MAAFRALPVVAVTVVAVTVVAIFVLSLSAVAQAPLAAQPSGNDSGRTSFETRCGRCHGGDGKGGEMGPDITGRLAGFPADAQLTALIHNGLPASGMPPSTLEGAELSNLLRFLRAIEVRGAPGATARRQRVAVQLTDGAKLEGAQLGEGMFDLQLRTDDEKIHLLRKSGDRFREVTSEVDWPQYNGDPRGNRYTVMTQIDRTNVTKLAPRWVFAYPAAGGGRGASGPPPPPPTRLQMTPVVVQGIMYIANVNECIALDAGSGRQLWRFSRPRTNSLPQSPGVNRGVAVNGDKVFLETDNAHILAINRLTGQQMWDSTIADSSLNYFATSAPLAAGNLVVAGVGGGEHGANGVIVAFDQTTGKEAWRFNAVPAPGQPGAENWKGTERTHGGAPTWFTGSYDPELDTVYWPTGNPAQEYNGDSRAGDNLYSDCILALDRSSGKLKCHYQFTPHDLWDWDSTETAVLVDAPWQGTMRKLLLHADRNGFYYVFDRTDGKLLFAKQFLNKLTWASGIGTDGRPIQLPNQEPSATGTLVCPSQDGATNWYSPSFSPKNGMYYFQTNEKCSVYTKREQPEWKAGESYLGGTQRGAPDPRPQRILRAVDYQTGKIRWEISQPGGANTWGGTLATATGLVFFEEERGAFVAADAQTGRILWSFQANTPDWHASPMAYQFDGKEYVAIVSDGNIITLSIVE